MMGPRLATALLAVLGLSAAAVPAAAVDPASAGDASTTAPATVRADQAWQRGLTGDGVGVALIDTGVSPHPELSGVPARQIDVSGPGRVTDGHGHGTFLAGLTTGQQGPDGPLGIAPGADLWSVKVANADGETTLEQVLAGLAIVLERAEDLGIRVVVLALGGPADDVPDPIEVALEQLWAQGLVVVVASGNEGSTVTEPGVSPYLLTVGAVDDRGTAEVVDDRPVAWSGTGIGRDGRPKPDLLAPGKSLVSVRVQGSTADRENRDSRVGSRWFRGSGTSMAAAVAAGSAALLLEAHPELTPDEVKGRLTGSARPTDGASAGVLDVVAAIDTPAPAANQHLPAIEPVDAEPAGAVPSWIGKSWIGKSWIDHQWDGKSWIGDGWSSDHWVGRSWTSRSF